MNRSTFVGALALVAVLPAAAVSVGGFDRVAGAAGRPSLTVYSNNLALVRMDLDRTIAPGQHTVRIDGLPTNLDQSSLVVLNDGVTLLGAHSFRSYQSPASGPGASLDLELEVERQVERLHLAFLTSGLGWSADYSLVIAPGDAAARVGGFATVSNNSGAGYELAEVQLLAGTINRGVGGRIRMDEVRGSLARKMSAEAAAPGLDGAAFGGYHIYTVSTPISLRPGESRRIRLLGDAAAAVEKVHTLSHTINYYQQQPEPLNQPVVVSYRVKRELGTEFGDLPLPAGQVRIYQPDEVGRLQLLGIASTANTPKGQDLRLTTGYAFDIVGTRTQTDYRRPEGNIYESAWKVELRNQSDSAVTVRVVEGLSGDWRILESSHRAEKLSAGAVRFLVDVPAGGRAVLEYRVRVRT